MNRESRHILAGAGALTAAFLLSGCSWVGMGGESNDFRSADTLQRRTVENAGDVGSASPLQPGDHIRVSSWREEGLTDEFVIDENGTVVLPLLGPRNATEESADRFKASLVEDYEAQFRNHTVGVTLLRRVSILGAVRTPGVYHVDPTMSISEAIALAGGPDETGKMDEVTIYRGGEEIVTELNRRTPLQTYVRSGDQIVVPQRSWFSRNAVFLIGSSISAAAIIITSVF